DGDAAVHADADGGPLVVIVADAHALRLRFVVSREAPATFDFGAGTGDVHRADASTSGRPNVGCLSRRPEVDVSAKRTTAPGAHTQATSTATEHRRQTLS